MSAPKKRKRMLTFYTGEHEANFLEATAQVHGVSRSIVYRLAAFALEERLSAGAGEFQRLLDAFPEVADHADSRRTRPSWIPAVGDLVREYGKPRGEVRTVVALLPECGPGGVRLSAPLPAGSIHVSWNTDALVLIRREGRRHG